MTAYQSLRRCCLIISGGITIGLELVTSRILTPYFGSSLYVWTAILSVTLAALAAGYFFGGRWTDYKKFQPAHFSYAFLIGAAGLILARILSSFILVLASGNLVVGSFIGSLIVLGPTLVIFSALNPILIALEHNTEQKDSGGGFVFAISTVGSILGAIVTSFLLVPYFRALDILLIFAGISLILAFFSAIVGRYANANFLTALMTCVALLAVVALKFNVLQSVQLRDGSVSLVKSFQSAMAQVSVLELKHTNKPTKLLYLQNGGLQGITYENGQPAAQYAYIIDRIIAARVPLARRVLVLGLAAGSIPKLLYQRGITVDAVDINSDAPLIASNYFKLDLKQVHVDISDIRVALRTCSSQKNKYDAVVFDVFSGIDPILQAATVETFHDARNCLTPSGILTTNIIVLKTDSPLLKALAAGFSSATGLQTWGYLNSVPTGNFPFNIILASGGEHPDWPVVLPKRDFPSDPDVAPTIDMNPIALRYNQSDALYDAIGSGTLLFAHDEIKEREQQHLQFPVGW